MHVFDLSGELALVIGGTGSLGGAIAKGLGEAGADVLILGRNEKKGEGRVSEIVKKGGRANFIKADAMIRKSLEEARGRIEKSFGTPSILINAAGGNDHSVTINETRHFEDIEPKDWRSNVELNLNGGVLFPCQVFGPPMLKKGRGSIINIASVAAHIPLSKVVSYSASKAAVLNLTQFLARQWAQKGVRVNSITPGFFPAKQNKKLLSNEDGSPTSRARAILDHTPMGRFGEAKELVGAVIFLASDRASSFVTGTDIRVDGGFLCQTI